MCYNKYDIIKLPVSVRYDVPLVLPLTGALINRRNRSLIQDAAITVEELRDGLPPSGKFPASVEAPWAS